MLQDVQVIRIKIQHYSVLMQRIARLTNMVILAQDNVLHNALTIALSKHMLIEILMLSYVCMYVHQIFIKMT